MADFINGLTLNQLFYEEAGTIVPESVIVGLPLRRVRVFRPFLELAVGSVKVASSCSPRGRRAVRCTNPG